MFWNEKIDLIKKKYSNEDFSVPHVNRKEILRKIESKFIKRNEDYYDLNNSKKRFTNWWDNLKSNKETLIEGELKSNLEQFINTNQKYWFVCEFSNQILVYKSKLSPIINLISIGHSKTNTFHIIEPKYDFFLGLRIEKDKITIRYVVDQKSFKYFS